MACKGALHSGRYDLIGANTFTRMCRSLAPVAACVGCSLPASINSIPFLSRLATTVSGGQLSGNSYRRLNSRSTHPCASGFSRILISTSRFSVALEHHVAPSVQLQLVLPELLQQLLLPVVLVVVLLVVLLPVVRVVLGWLQLVLVVSRGWGWGQVGKREAAQCRWADCHCVRCRRRGRLRR